MARRPGGGQILRPPVTDAPIYEMGLPVIWLTV
jgi:hypothetical protein